MTCCTHLLFKGVPRIPMYNFHGKLGRIQMFVFYACEKVSGFFITRKS